MEKEFKRPEEGPRAKIYLDSLKKYHIWKRLAMMTYIDTSLKNSLPPTTDGLSEWIDA